MAAPAESVSTAHAAWALVSRLWLGERPRINEQLAELGLHPMQALALRVLEPGEPRPMSALAGALRCDASNITGIADRLEAAGLVVRRAEARDRRVKTLVLTELGCMVRERVAKIWQEPPAQIAGLPEEDLATLLEILQRAS